MPAKSHVSLLKGTPFITGRFFFCPSCSQIRRFCIKPASSPKSIRKRYASTFPGSSIVSATKNIPERFQDLYKALEELKNTSASYVDSSRLQLAQRGIESENPMIRIAGEWGVSYTDRYRKSSILYWLLLLIVLGLGGTKTVGSKLFADETSNLSPYL